MFFKRKIGRYFDRKSYEEFTDRREKAAANLIKSLVAANFNKDQCQAKSALDAIKIFSAFQLAKNVDNEVALRLVEQYQNCIGRDLLYQADREYLDYFIKLALNNPPYSELNINKKIDREPVHIPNVDDVDEVIKAKYYIVTH